MSHCESLQAYRARAPGRGGARRAAGLRVSA
jgi:hypothetical protein